MNQEESSRKVNLEAARALARQVRLRDLGGIIVVDFIDMREERNKKMVYDELKNQFRTDRAVTKILPMSDFGLMQITRQRLRPSITTTFDGLDTPANGASKKDAADTADNQRRRNRPPRREQEARPAPAAAAPDADLTPAQMLQTLEQWIVGYKAGGRGKTVKLCVHPFTAAYLNRGLPNQATRWWLKHRLRIRVEPDKKLDPMAYRFVDLTSGKDLTDLNGLDPNRQPKQEVPAAKK